MNPTVFLTSVLCFLLLLATFNLLRYRKKFNDLCRQHIALNKELYTVNSENCELKSALELNHSFSRNLQEAEATSNELKLSHARYLTSVTEASIPERYHYLSSLSDRCVDTDEVARLFSVSTQEAEQLAALSRLNIECSKG